MGLFDQMVANGDTTPVEPSSSRGVELIKDMGLQERVGDLDIVDPTMGYRGSPVQWSDDLDRICELPRRKIDLKDKRAAAAWSKHLRAERVEPCDCIARWGFCIKELREIQGWALEDASNAGGFLGPIGVGHGKEGICILAPFALESKRAVLLIPANLRPQLLTRDYPQWAAHFAVPSVAGGAFKAGRPVLHVMSYNDLSSPKASSILSMIGPDLIICNEVQNLGRREATRTKRFLRYFAEHPDTRLFAVSGTLTKKSIKDYAHIAELAFKEKSPLPLHWPTVEEWAGAIDASDAPAPVGQLRRLCATGETARQGFRRRLIETRGVVGTEEGALDTLLTISERRGLKVPAEVEQLIGEVRGTWQRPDGEELVDALTKSNVCRQLACGFYYVWRWPRKEPDEVRDAWLDARKQWHKEVREKLKRSVEHMDSPLLVTKAAIRWHEGYHVVQNGHEHSEACYGPPYEVTHSHGEDCRASTGCPETDTRRDLVCGTAEGKGGRRVFIPPHTKGGPLPTWDAEHWPRWKELRDTAQPETSAVWVSDFLIDDAAEWARTRKGIVWYEHSVVGPRVAAKAKVPHYGGGVEASTKILVETGKRSIVASSKAHGTGKNLQMFAECLVINPFADAAAWEQTLARIHRPGQLAEQVTAEVYRHTEEMRAAIDEAILRARYIKETLGGAQKLLYATIDFQT